MLSAQTFAPDSAPRKIVCESYIAVVSLTILNQRCFASIGLSVERLTLDKVCLFRKDHTSLRPVLSPRSWVYRRLHELVHLMT